MLRRILAVALIGLFASLALLPATPTQANQWFDEELRSWNYTGLIDQRYPLKLATAEDYDRYYFGFEDGAEVIVGEIAVRHTATGDLVCQKYLIEANGVDSYLMCNDLVVGRSYTVVVKLTWPAKTKLWGVDV